MIDGGLDHTKAFVRCEWKWIMLCFEKFGFDPKFRKWVDILLKSSISAIQTNDFLSSFFPITRSIKQGCPIACLLYVIQAEPMACSTRKCNTIQCIDLDTLQSDVQHKEAKISQYVDDAHFICEKWKLGTWFV